MFSHLIIDQNFDGEIVRKFKSKKEADWFIEGKAGLKVVKNPDFKPELQKTQQNEYEKSMEDCGLALL